MPEPRLISPLLDGFSMGSPMSSHDGIICCPAIKENTDKKYIVKIISVPASQAQMDALLLAGAYKDPADAMNYFREMGEGILKEAELLKTLSKLDGFLSYDGWQMEPIAKHRLGFEIYLVGSYKRSLEKYVRGNPVTHLEAINLGLDLCSALAVCRQAGALYVDLKPSNIYLSDKKEYRIGDLGFISLDAMKYAAIPDRYRSDYTPPELRDPMNPLNLTADTYAVGMILYQLYNDGQLPFHGSAPEEPLPSPLNADYELAEIIMRAIHPDPEARWKDPEEMGHALATYLQRNTVNDTPITPYTPLEIDPEENPPIAPPKPAEPASSESDNAPSAEGSQEDAEESSSFGEEPSSPEGEPEDEGEKPEAGETEQPENPAEDSDEHPGVELPEDETLPDSADGDDLLPHEMSDELSRILSKADDLIAHETPGGVVLPEIPDPPDPFAFAKEDDPEAEDASIPVDPLMDDPEADKEEQKKKAGAFASQKGKKFRKKLISLLIFLLALSGLSAGSYWYYQNLYLQTIRDLDVDGTKHELTVTLDTDADNSLLSVVCSDGYGTTLTQPVVNNQAVFTGLTPDTLYKIQLEVDGFHALTGKTSDVFTTDTTTSILSFTTAAGNEDGSVVLNFTVEGEEPEEWKLSYVAEGEEEQVLSFSDHSVTVSGLTIGKVYTFTLDAGDSLSLSGQTSLEYMASRLIVAENLTISSDGEGDITIHWNAPGGVVVNSWNVRCYSDGGYDQQQNVTDTQAQFTGVDPSYSYTVEVTAAGMTQPARGSITANPINITQFTVDNEEDPDLDTLKVHWEYSGDAPEDGWLLMYSIDGSTVPNVVKCSKASAEISPMVPDAKYQFTIEAADGTSIFNNVYTYTVPEAEEYEGNGLTAQDIEASLLKTPTDVNWRGDTVSSSDFTDQFSPGDGISVVLHGTKDFYLPGYELNILYVIQDAYGNVIPDLVSETDTYWKELWYAGDYHFCELTLPKAPQSAGDYELRIYFDGMAVAQLPFTIAN